MGSHSYSISIKMTTGAQELLDAIPAVSNSMRRRYMRKLTRRQRKAVRRINARMKRRAP